MSQDHPAEIDSPTMTDLDALVELWIDLAAGQRQHDSHLEAEANRDRIRESLARQIALSEIRVARAAGRIVGFVSFTIEGSTFERSTTKGLIQNIYVEPDAREQGIGSRLLDRAESVLDAEGADVVSLEVMADNEAARRFYQRHGYDTHRVTLEKSTESDTS
jgi:ribosomal protein S18 acetylase RimI-like enzyme